MEVIYNLLELRGLKLVMCANSINFIGELGQDRVGSRMSAFKRINLPDYEAEDYRQLLKIRFESGKPKLDLAQLADEKAIKLLVARCKMQGDLRMFFGTTFRAFCVAHMNGAEKLTTKYVS